MKKIPILAQALYTSNVIMILVSIGFIILRSIGIIKWTLIEAMLPAIVMYVATIVIFVGFLIVRSRKPH